MIASEIMLPPHAPEIYLDRATLWNAVESCEKHPKAQLAYSFDIAMQNELTLEENMAHRQKIPGLTSGSRTTGAQKNVWLPMRPSTR